MTRATKWQTRIALGVMVPVMALMLSVAPARAQSLQFLRDSEIEYTLDRMSAPILRAAGLPEQTVEIYLVNNRSLNAFVAGGRNIFLFSGLLMKLEKPEELIGVIAHEVGHISGGHLARRSINVRNARGPAMVGLLAGILAAAAGAPEAGVALAVGSQQAVQRSLLNFNRAEEGAADQAAVEYMKRAGIDPKGMLAVLEEFRGQEVFNVGNVDPYALTHPLSTQRVQLLQRRIEEIGPVSGGLPDDIAYWHGRMRAKLEGFLTGAERILDRLEGQPEDELTLYRKAIALHRLPRPDDAVAAVDRLIALRPNDPYYNELRGQILLESGRAREAVPSYRRAVALAPGDTLLLAGLGRSLLQLGSPEADREALDALQKARDQDPSDATGLRDLAMAYARTGDDAMAALATAERYALVGNLKDATLFAKRAVAKLPAGSPPWLRAQDIIALDDNG